MSNETLRALRRHHMERLKAKWKRTQWKNQASVSFSSSISEEKQSGMFVKTRVLCSCWMCGNPRKHLGLRSIQELRAMQSRLHDGSELSESDFSD
ncbi:hypothetical protein [Undibacterium sp.]|uniref:hypothetical protein n=1 Tax=Undibacterium sp. TaxID=1914977 RepID=UPI0037521815